MDLPKRKRNRLPNFDYSTPGAYFLTVCVENKKCLLGEIVGGGDLDAPQVSLTEMGRIVQRNIELSKQIPNIHVDKYIVMPNHIHLILLVDGTTTSRTSMTQSPTNTVIPHYISTLKRFCHKEIGAQLFQRSYHDHVIRGKADYLKIWEYIDNNPTRWKEDCFYGE
jgi:REP element-mobilizing transposase RayT